MPFAPRCHQQTAANVISVAWARPMPSGCPKEDVDIFEGGTATLERR